MVIRYRFITDFTFNLHYDIIEQQHTCTSRAPAAMAPFDYTGKVVLITGIGAVGDGYGNGTAMAAVMARQGAKIFGCDINLEAANRARDAINSEAEVKTRSEDGAIAVAVFQQSTVGLQHIYQLEVY